MMDFRDTEIRELAREYFSRLGFEILNPVGYVTRAGAKETYPLFRVYRMDLGSPLPIITLRGSSQWREVKLKTWLALTKQLFVIDSWGVLFYIVGCDLCPEAREIRLQTFLAPQICNHQNMSSIGPIEPPKYTSGSTIERLYSFLEDSFQALNMDDLKKGRPIRQNGSYLFSAIHSSKALGISATVLRESLKSIGSEPAMYYKFGKLNRVWTLPISRPVVSESLIGEEVDL